MKSKNCIKFFIVFILLIDSNILLSQFDSQTSGSLPSFPDQMPPQFPAQQVPDQQITQPMSQQFLQQVPESMPQQFPDQIPPQQFPQQVQQPFPQQMQPQLPTVAAVSLTGEPSKTPDQSFDDKMEEISKKADLLEKINLCNQNINFVDQTTSQERKNKLVQVYIELFNSKDKMKKAELEALNNLFQSSLNHPFLLTQDQKNVMTQWVASLTIDDNYLQNLLNEAANKTSVSDKLEIYKKFTDFITPTFVSTFIPKITEIYNARNKNTLDELIKLNELFKNIKENTIITPSLPPEFAQWQQNVLVDYTTKLIENAETNQKKIELCENLLQQITGEIGLYEKDLFYIALSNVYSNRQNMDNQTLESLKNLFEKVVAKDKLFLDDKKKNINEWITNLTPTAQPSTQLVTLLDLASTNQNYDREFSYFKKALKIFEKKPNRKIIANFVPALNNLWSNRFENEKKLSSLKKVFEKINERDDILITTAQKRTMQNWLQVLDQECLG